MGVLDTNRMSSEALTALTLLVAESRPQDKERVIGLVGIDASETIVSAVRNPHSPSGSIPGMEPDRDIKPLFPLWQK